MKVAFGLSRAGLLVLVDLARLERLGELVRTLLPLAPDVDVYTEAPSLRDVPFGSTCVLIPRAEDADWLNINRPLFASRALRVVLFCTREVSVELSRRAVDFMDWVSLRLECPTGPPPFAVAGLRHAVAAGVPGIVWRGGDLETSFAAALPHRTLRWISASRPYAELVAEAKARGPREWLAWTGVDEDFQLRRVRWALAEVEQRTRSILVEPMVRSSGWWEVQGQCLEPAKIRGALLDTKVHHPFRLAALVDLELEAIQLMDALLERGVEEHILEKEVTSERDPGAAIGRLAFTKGIVTPEQWIRDRAPLPTRRALRAERKLARKLRRDELETLETRLMLGEQLDADDAEWWSAWATTYPSPLWLEGSLQQGAVAETLLRQHQGILRWSQVANIALSIGDSDTADTWSKYAADADLAHWEFLLPSSPENHSLDNAELLLRQQLTQGGQDSSDEHARLLYLLGSTLYSKGEYTSAEQFLSQSISLLEQSSGPSSSYYSASIQHLALIRKRQGRFQEAEELLRKSIFLDAKTRGAQSLRNSESQYELAVLLEHQGRYAEAEPLLRQSLDLTAQLFGDHHPKFGAALYALAGVREMQGHYSEAEDLLRQSLTIAERAFGINSPTCGATLEQLTDVLARQGRYAEAEEFMRRALAVAESISLSQNKHADLLSKLAKLLELQDRDKEAEDLLRQCLELQEQILEPQDPRLCLTLTQYGISLFKQGRVSEGEPFLLRAVDIARSSLGLQHPDTAQCLNALAHVQAALKRPEAITTAQQALDGLLHSFCEEHPLVKSSLPLLRRIIAGEE